MFLLSHHPNNFCFDVYERGKEIAQDRQCLELPILRLFLPIPFRLAEPPGAIRQPISDDVRVSRLRLNTSLESFR